MLNSLPVSGALDALVPITRFNRGEASKIFDEVEIAGYKIVVKNNAPICVLITPDKYKEMADMIEDQYLLALVQERERNGSGATIPFSDILAKHGTTLEELDEIPMEYGVDFE